MDWIQQIDNHIILWIQEYTKCSFLDWFMPQVSWLGDKGFFWILLGLMLIAAGKQYRRWGIVMLLSLAITAFVTNLAIKPFFARPRPFDTLMFDILIAPPHDFSFPSGHTSAAVSVAVTALFINRKIGIGMLIFAILMAFSRMYLGVHYLTDVLAGAAIGALVSIATVFLMRQWIDKNNKKV